MYEKSKGHICFTRTHEFYESGGEVYRAPLDNVFDVRTHQRIGRWECSSEHFERYQEVIVPEVWHIA